MTFDFKKLRGKMIEKYGTQADFAKAYGVSNTTLSCKMQNKRPFTTRDILKMVKMLDIPKEEVGVYFFTEKV